MNPYEILEIQPGASSEEIKVAYMRLAKAWHPDRFSADERLHAALRYRELTEAFAQLKGSARPTSDPAPSPAPVPAAPAQTMQRIALDVYTPGVEEPGEMAKNFFESGQYPAALNSIEDALKMDPEKYEYHALHAKLLQVMDGDKRTLVQALEHCLRLDKKDSEAAIALAETYQSLGMHTRATKYWEWAYTLAPQHPHFQKEAGAPRNKALETVGDLGGSIRGLLQETKGIFGRFGKKN